MGYSPISPFSLPFLRDILVRDEVLPLDEVCHLAQDPAASCLHDALGVGGQGSTGAHTIAQCAGGTSAGARTVARGTSSVESSSLTVRLSLAGSEEGSRQPPDSSVAHVALWEPVLSRPGVLRLWPRTG